MNKHELNDAIESIMNADNMITFAHRKSLNGMNRCFIHMMLGFELHVMLALTGNSMRSWLQIHGVHRMLNAV